MDSAHKPFQRRLKTLDPGRPPLLEVFWIGGVTPFVGLSVSAPATAARDYGTWQGSASISGQPHIGAVASLRDDGLVLVALCPLPAAKTFIY